jgi:hypothetical protein
MVNIHIHQFQPGSGTVVDAAALSSSTAMGDLPEAGR